MEGQKHWASEAYNFSSCANDSMGDNVPEVKIIERTPRAANFSMAIPGLKHHQLRVLDVLPTNIKIEGDIHIQEF